MTGVKELWYTCPCDSSELQWLMNHRHYHCNQEWVRMIGPVPTRDRKNMRWKLLFPSIHRKTNSRFAEANEWFDMIWRTEVVDVRQEYKSAWQLAWLILANTFAIIFVEEIISWDDDQSWVQNEIKTSKCVSSRRTRRTAASPGVKNCEYDRVTSNKGLAIYKNFVEKICTPGFWLRLWHSKKKKNSYHPSISRQLLCVLV